MAVRVIKGTDKWNAVIDGVTESADKLKAELRKVVSGTKAQREQFESDMRPYFETQRDRDLETPNGRRGHVVKTTLNKIKDVKGAPKGWTLSTTKTNGCEKDDKGKLVSNPVLMKSKGNGNNNVKDHTVEQATRKLNTFLGKFPLSALGRLVDMHPNALHKLVADAYDGRMAQESNKKPATRKANANKATAKKKATTRKRKAS